DNELIILARSAEKAETIDLARAQASEARAKQRIAAKASDLDLKRAELSLHRALAREKAYAMLHKN
ncbi:MAG: F0F1 ATP synthase subunit epsilon, partial [Firmicutes bacterium]|nr:F0F1 ATP synthase subunit epsilon [Bacillota bacterium]